MSGRRAHSSYPRWWVILAIWTAWGLLLSTQVAVYVRLGGKPMPFLTALRLNMPGALVWAIFTPAAIWRRRRQPRGQRRRRFPGSPAGDREPAVDPGPDAERRSIARGRAAQLRMVVSAGWLALLGDRRKRLRRRALPAATGTGAARLAARSPALRGAAGSAQDAAPAALPVQCAAHHRPAHSHRSGCPRRPRAGRARRPAAAGARWCEYAGGALEAGAGVPAELPRHRADSVRGPPQSGGGRRGRNARRPGALSDPPATRRKRDSSRDRAAQHRRSAPD